MMPKTWGNYWDYFGQRLVDELHLEPGSRVLDVGTGGGSTLYPAANAVGTEGSVIGIELWDSMVDCLKGLILRAIDAGIQSIFIADPGRSPFEEVGRYFVKSEKGEVMDWTVDHPYQIQGRILRID